MIFCVLKNLLIGGLLKSVEVFSGQKRSCMYMACAQVSVVLHNAGHLLGLVGKCFSIFCFGLKRIFLDSAEELGCFKNNNCRLSWSFM